VFNRRIKNAPPALDFRYKKVERDGGTVVSELDYMSSQSSEKAPDLGCGTEVT
jgi:hypothetical protein